MSLADNFKTKVGIKVLTPADIQKSLDEAKNELIYLEASRPGAALDAVAKVSGADKILADLNAKIAEARERVSNLALAHEGAVAREAAAIAKSRSDLRKTQFRALCKELDKATEASITYSQAIATAAQAYRQMHEHLQKAEHACPVGTEWPRHAITEREIVSLAAGEAWRHTAPYGALHAEPNVELVLPGASPYALEFKGNPEATPALADVIKQRSDEVKAELRRLVQDGSDA